MLFLSAYQLSIFLLLYLFENLCINFPRPFPGLNVDKNLIPGRSIFVNNLLSYPCICSFAWDTISLSDCRHVNNINKIIKYSACLQRRALSTDGTTIQHQQMYVAGWRQQYSQAHTTSNRGVSTECGWEATATSSDGHHCPSGCTLDLHVSTGDVLKLQYLYNLTVTWTAAVCWTVIWKITEKMLTGHSKLKFYFMFFCWVGWTLYCFWQYISMYRL